MRKILTKCNLCKKENSVFPSRLKIGKGKFCSKKCFYLSIKGKKHSEEHKRKIGLAGLGRKFPYKQKTKIKGNKNWNWKGGITSLRGQIYKDIKTRQWRSDVFERDDYTCQWCRNKGIYLEAHHIKEFYFIIKENKIKTLEDALNCAELWNINNGLTLCRKCHNTTKKGRGTSGE